ncbi:hypothetical protein BDF19DRAFT_175416 [Syncephalis fuscata]|nr:hypothetical protein BDF19DRAFT_175416 [Syncephalis fuscata]
MYTVLFTHQKNKKTKTWQDGYITVCLQTSKVVLYDNAKTRLGSLFLRGQAIEIGEQYEMDRYLIQIEGTKELQVSNSAITNDPVQKAASTPISTDTKASKCRYYGDDY